MYATLVVVGGKADKRQLNIKLPTMLGRSRQADLTIAHSLISRKHCELRESEGMVLLVDLGSLNGTFCRDRKIQRVPLLPNDRFAIGPLTFEIRYEYDGDGKPTSQPDVEAADGPTIELADPIETSLVELDDPVEVSGPRPNLVETMMPGNAISRRNKRLPGFDYQGGLPEGGEEGEPCDHRGGETIEIDLSPDHPAPVPFDAPTGQCQSPLVDPEPESTDSPGGGTERTD